MTRTGNVLAGYRKVRVYQPHEVKNVRTARVPVLADTDIREYDTRGIIRSELIGKPETMNLLGVEAMAQAWGTMLQTNPEVMFQGPNGPMPYKNVGIVYDLRQDSYDAARYAATGLQSTGLNIYNLGLGITPMGYAAYYNLNRTLGEPTAIFIITASHNENGWLGSKVAFGPSLTPGPIELNLFRQVLFGGNFLSGSGTYQEFPGMQQAYMQELLRNPILTEVGRKLKVVVGTFNGVAGEYLPKFLKQIGHEVVPLFTELDWTYPNGAPNPENEDNLRALQQKVVETKADLGLGVDADGDRLGVVDNNGETIYADKVGMLTFQGLWPIFQALEISPEIVIDIKSTGAWFVWDFFKEIGGKIYIVPTGHYYVKDGMRARGLLNGQERSGHAMFGDPKARLGFGLYGYDDATAAGALLVRAISLSKMSASEMHAILPTTYQTPNMQPKIADESKKYDMVVEMVRLFEDFKTKRIKIAGKNIRDLVVLDSDSEKAYAKALGMPSSEAFGVRVVLEDNTWVLVRASANKPVFVILGESTVSNDAVREATLHICRILEKKYNMKLGSEVEEGSYDQFMGNYQDIRTFEIEGV